MARCPTLTLTAATLVVAAIIADRLLSPPPTREQLPAKSIYEFTAVDIRGQETSIADIARGKVTLIVNTASKCGYAHVYDDLQRLYEKYGPLGFTVLGERQRFRCTRGTAATGVFSAPLNVSGFPCDQFLGQELDDEAAIDEFVCSAFHVTFPMFSKVDVNGAGTHPLFRFLKVSRRYRYARL